MTHASTTDTPSGPAPTSDYELVGGGRAVSTVVDAFYERVLADPTLAPYFTGKDMTALKRHQVQMVSQVMGGPAEYSGRDLQTAHHGLDITSAAFTRVAEHLVDAMRGASVPDDVVMRVVSALAGTERDVVSAPG